MLFFLFSLSLVPPPCPPQLIPFHTGTVGATAQRTWRRAEAEPWRGEGWLGWQANGRMLLPVRVFISPAEGPSSADELAVASGPPVDFAIRCIPQVREGAIHGAWTQESDLLADGPAVLSLGGERYEVRIDASAVDLSDAKVVLAHGRQQQVLYSAAGGVSDEPHYLLEWAGDLDRDGKLDLIVNLSRKYSEHPYRLLLSSRASPTELVGDAATFVTGD